jgi:hypothetical protein
MGEQMAKRVCIIPGLVRAAASSRYRRGYEEYIVAMNVLPCPVHISPLALLLVRERDACMRHTDAISLLMRLHILRHCMHEMDTDNPEHKQRCWKYFKIIEQYASVRHYQEIDRICKLDLGNGAEIARLFGVSATRYALDLIHAVEWCCLDILKIPYEWRHLFMTPNDTPPGEALAPTAFQTMRSHTINYVSNRNITYCGLFVDEVSDPKTGAKKRVYKGIHPEAWQPMHLDQPPLDQRPLLLNGTGLVESRSLSPSLPPSLPLPCVSFSLPLVFPFSLFLFFSFPRARCFPRSSSRALSLSFSLSLSLWDSASNTRPAGPSLGPQYLVGIFNGWIDLHTLREYMHMLQADSRPKPERQVLGEDEQRERQQQQTQ